MQALREHFPGFALVNLNYRLVSGNENQYPTAENDVKQAIDFLYRQLEPYQLSPDTYLAGGSAGAHLAALHSLKYNDDGRIKGCIAIAGVYNMVSLYEYGNAEAKLFVSAFMGGTPTDQANRYEQASPIMELLAGTYGPSRLLWGSDFSPCLEYVSFPQTLGPIDRWQRLTDADRASIKGGNLMGLLREGGFIA